MELELKKGNSLQSSLSPQAINSSLIAQLVLCQTMNSQFRFVLFTLLLSTVVAYSPSFQANNNTIRSRKLLIATRHQTVGGGLPCLPTAFAVHYCAASVHSSRFTNQLVPAGEQPIDSLTASHPVGNWVNGAATIESSINDLTAAVSDENSWSLLLSVFSAIFSIAFFVFISICFIVLSALILWPVFLCWQLLGLFLLYNPDMDPFNFALPKLLSSVVRAIALF